MKRLASVKELNEMRDKLKDKMGIRHDVPNNIQVVVCMGTCGIAAGAPAVLSAITKEVGRLNLQNVTVAHKSCPGNCEKEPIVEVIVPGKGSVTYVNMNPQKAVKVIGEHVVGGKPIVEYSKYGRIKGFE